MKTKAGHTLEMTVKDKGIGFRMPSDNLPNPGHHFGLRSVAERIQDLGGQLHIESDIGKGCTVTLTIPLRHIPIKGPSYNGAA